MRSSSTCSGSSQVGCVRAAGEGQSAGLFGEVGGGSVAAGQGEVGAERDEQGDGEAVDALWW